MRKKNDIKEAHVSSKTMFCYDHFKVCILIIHYICKIDTNIGKTYNLLYVG